MPAQIPFFQHDLGKAELDAIAEVFEGPILTTGETVARFEQAFSDYLGRKYTLGVTSCTGAMHMSLLALGIGPGDEVITTPMTFIATSCAIMQVGARPVFVDVEPDTGNLDASKVEAAITPRTKAIIPVHLYGLMCDMRALRKIADQYRLKIIEDCAHCIEGERDGVRPGQLSDTACFSFFATKNITSGEGGAVVTDDPALYQKLKLLRLHGMNKTSADRFKEGYQHWDMTMLGWKYNMDNIQAAILLPQMERIQSNLRKRQVLAQRYQDCLKELPEVRWPLSADRTHHARHLFPIWVPARKRDLVVEGLQKQGVSVVVNYRAIHLLSYFAENLKYRPGDFPNAEKIGNETISLPLYPKMPLEHVDVVVDRLKAVI